MPRSPPGDLLNPGTEPRSPTLQADSLPSEPPVKPPLAKGNRDLKQNMFTKGFHTFTLWAKLFLFGSLGGILPFGRLVQAPESIS